MLTESQSQLVAATILLGLVALLLTWAVVAARRSPLTPAQNALYYINLVLARTLWRAKVSGRLPVPPGQGAVIICNHTSSVDTCFVQLAAGKRVVHWLVAAEYFQNPVFGWILRNIECIPVNRGGVDTAATRLAIRYLRQGDLVGLFPEGRINTTDKLLLPGRPGAAMMALAGKAPVVPCYVSGVPYNGTVLGSLLMPAHVECRIGEAIDLTPYYERRKEDGVTQDLTRRFLSEIAALAGEYGFVPEIAGRQWKNGQATDGDPDDARGAAANQQQAL